MNVDNRLLDYMIVQIEKIDKKLDAKVIGIEEQISHLEDKVDKLLAFKFQMVGGALMISVVMTAGFQIFLAAVFNK